MYIYIYIYIYTVHIYMPTSTHEDVKVEEMYENMDEMIKKQKGTDFVMVMGDFNAEVAEERREGVTGSYGLGERNERGERLAQYCKEQDMVVCNTWFNQSKRRR